ncbi:thioredoxin reductase [Reichenbachiella versicolor]|uniref:thioredoxin reductase n=1 Tax=Reichenbachiella versicolor TaxID=1821036 RepID=UPI000D6DF5C3|nr:thioredoxin reductase [Reichenbachiella versicolor]
MTLNSTSKKHEETEILIVGFGLTIIPLLRELRNDGKKYTIISDGNSVWERFENEDRLDFDLVSSVHTSMYSFELTDQSIKDRYPTSQEFLDFQRKHFKDYKSDVIKDFVSEVKNFKDHSLVYTEAGRAYKTKHLIFATAFKRLIHKSLNKFDYDAAEGKTVAFNVFGDSANLMVSKLIPRNCNIHLITNGFVCLDKLCFYNGVSYTLEQLEFHNIRKISTFLYENLLTGLGALKAGIFPRFIGKLFFGSNFTIKYPLSDRIGMFMRDFERKEKSGFANGFITVKYWPVDAYEKLFGGKDLKQNIERGYRLNDIALFVEKGMVKLWGKADTTIDEANKTFTSNGETIKYDFLIEGDNERPNLPPITYIDENGEEALYNYEHRNTYLGVVPRELNNVYEIGYTRPTTGGLVNLAEMQCLLTHKLVTEEDFHSQIFDNLEERIEKYNRAYYTTKDVRPKDHLVHAGFFTEDVAQVIGINPKLSDCRSIKDVLQFFIAPNIAYTYRRSGRYKVEGMEEMFQKVWKEHNGFKLIKQYISNYLLIQLNCVLLFSLLPIPWYAKVPLIAVQLLNPFVGMIQSRAIPLHGYQNLILLLGIAGTIAFPSFIAPLSALSLTLLVTVLGRKFGWSRLMFNDLKYKTQYDAFLAKYLSTCRDLFAKDREKKSASKETVATM